MFPLFFYVKKRILPLSHETITLGEIDMKYVLDTHTHTLASGHAYSTMNEMIEAAKQQGLELLCITEHSMTMPGTCHPFYFENWRIVDRNAYDVELMLGAELNILDESGAVDMEEELLEKMDITIASIHPPCYHPIDPNQVTQAYLNAMENPLIDIIGHPDDSRFPCDYEKLVKKAKETSTLLEVNCSSLSIHSYRMGARDNYKEMLSYCKQYEVPIVCGSDAHIDKLVGNHKDVYDLLQEMEFPETLVVNRSVFALKKYLHRYKNL